ncbi:hypothetical protein V6N13_083045 [Hibiscus sabdariffa]
MEKNQPIQLKTARSLILVNSVQTRESQLQDRSDTIPENLENSSAHESRSSFSSGNRTSISSDHSLGDIVRYGRYLKLYTSPSIGKTLFLSLYSRYSKYIP